jgi:uncharacterized protein YuzE
MATVTYDPQADALDICFTDGPSEGEEVYPGVILHFDVENRVVEIEILRESKVLAAGAGLKDLPLPEVAHAVTKLREIKFVKPWSESSLLVVFVDDGGRLVDLAPTLAQGGVFEPLRDQTRFAAVEVGPQGRTLVWRVGEDVIDLDVDALWAMAQPLPPGVETND